MGVGKEFVQYKPKRAPSPVQEQISLPERIAAIGAQWNVRSLRSPDRVTCAAEMLARQDVYVCIVGREVLEALEGCRQDIEQLTKIPPPAPRSPDAVPLPPPSPAFAPASAAQPNTYDASSPVPSSMEDSASPVPPVAASVADASPPVTPAEALRRKPWRQWNADDLRAFSLLREKEFAKRKKGAERSRRAG